MDDFQRGLWRLDMAIQEEMTRVRTLRRAKEELVAALDVERKTGSDREVRAVFTRYLPFHAELETFRLSCADDDTTVEDSVGDLPAWLDSKGEQVVRETIQRLSRANGMAPLSSGDLAPTRSLSALREARGFRRRDLADGMEVGEDLISALEEGRVRLASLPERALVRLGATLKVNAYTTLQVLRGSALQMLKAQSADSAAAASLRVDFADILLASPQMSEAQKQEWRHADPPASSLFEEGL